MPRYGEPDYDPNFDDSPPPSPKRRAFRAASTPSILGSIGLKLWRSRTIILIFISFTSFIYLLSRFRRSSPVYTPKHGSSLNYKNVNWKHYAYSQYATDSDHLCNAVMIFDTLKKYGSKADRVLMYPNTMDTVVSEIRDRDSQLLVMARDVYGVKLVPIEVPHVIKNTSVDNPAPFTDPSISLWDQSITKLMTFNLTQYLRIIHLDNDATLLTHLDSLFFLPSAPVAMPRAYWNTPSLSQSPPSIPNLLSSHLLLLEPSAPEAIRLTWALNSLDPNTVPAGTNLDTAVLNQLYADTALILPHQTYGLRSGEFRLSPTPSSPLHAPFFGYDPSTYPPPSNPKAANTALWDPSRALRKAALVHFSGDEPLPKPWVLWPQKLLGEIRPECKERRVEAVGNQGAERVVEEGCEDREAWLELYGDFRKRRKDVCGLLSVPAPMYQVAGGEKGKAAEKEAEKEGKERMGEGRERVKVEGKVEDGGEDREKEVENERGKDEEMKEVEGKEKTEAAKEGRERMQGTAEEAGRDRVAERIGRMAVL